MLEPSAWIKPIIGPFPPSMNEKSSSEHQQDIVTNSAAKAYSWNDGRISLLPSSTVRSDELCTFVLSFYGPEASCLFPIDPLKIKWTSLQKMMMIHRAKVNQICVWYIFLTHYCYITAKGRANSTSALVRPINRQCDSDIMFGQTRSLTWNRPIAIFLSYCWLETIVKLGSQFINHLIIQCRTCSSDFSCRQFNPILWLLLKVLHSTFAKHISYELQEFMSRLIDYLVMNTSW